MILLTLNEQEEKVIDKIISAITDYIQFEPTQIAPASVLSFSGLEIRQSQRRVIQDGKEVNLTRLEYSTLAYNPTFANSHAEYCVINIKMLNWMQ